MKLSKIICAELSIGISIDNYPALLEWLLEKRVSPTGGVNKQTNIKAIVIVLTTSNQILGPWRSESTNIIMLLKVCEDKELLFY